MSHVVLCWKNIKAFPLYLKGGSNINRVMKSRYGGKIGGTYSMRKENRKAYILLRIPEENRTSLRRENNIKMHLKER